MTITKLKKLIDKNFENKFLNPSRCGVKIAPDTTLHMVRRIGFVLMTFDNHRQTDKQTERT